MKYDFEMSVGQVKEYEGDYKTISVLANGYGKKKGVILVTRKKSKNSLVLRVK